MQPHRNGDRVIESRTNGRGIEHVKRRSSLCVSRVRAFAESFASNSIVVSAAPRKTT